MDRLGSGNILLERNRYGTVIHSSHIYISPLLLALSVLPVDLS